MNKKEEEEDNNIGLCVCGTPNSMIKIAVIVSIIWFLISLAIYYLNIDCNRYCYFKELCHWNMGTVFGRVGNIVSCAYAYDNGSDPITRYYSDNIYQHGIKEFKCECDSV